MDLLHYRSTKILILQAERGHFGEVGTFLWVLPTSKAFLESQDLVLRLGLELALG